MDEKLFLWKTRRLFNSVWDFDQKSSEFSKISAEDLPNSPLRVQMNIWKKKGFLKNLMTTFIDLELWAKNFRTSTETFQQSCKNCIPCFRKTSLNYNRFWQENFFLTFSDFEDKQIRSSAKSWAGCQKIHSPCPGKCFRENFNCWSKCYFILSFSDPDRSISDFDRKHFGFFPKPSLSFCQNLILGVQMKISRKFYSRESIVIFFSSILEIERQIVGV